MSATTDLTGLVYDMDDATYHARPELSSTGVRRILDSPARFQWERANRVEKHAYDFGHAAHAKVLGVGLDVVTYPGEHLTPSGNASTKVTTRAWEAEQRAAGLAPVTPDDMDRIDALAEAVLAHPVARALLEQPGAAEVSAFGVDPETGVECRARFDRLNTAQAVDLKTTRGSAGPHGFAREAANYGYPIQEAHYGAVHAWATGADEPLPMAFIVVEKAPPHLVAVHYFDEITRMVARELAAKARVTYAECVATDTWPGYSADPYVTQVPSWWLDQADDNYDAELTL